MYKYVKRSRLDASRSPEPGLPDLERILMDALPKEKRRTAYVQLHAAIVTGDTTTVKSLLEAGNELVNEFRHGKVASLHLASYFGHCEIVQLVLENGANVEVTDSRGNLPLHYVCHTDSADDTVKQLSEKYACRRNQSGREDLMKLLIERCININRKNALGKTALHVAAENGYADLVRTLVSSKTPANMKLREQSGLSPFDLACMEGHFEVVNVLLESGAMVNSDDNSRKRTPLLCAVQGDHAGIVNILLERGADIAAADSAGYTALHIAAERGCFTIVKILLNKGAAVNTKLRTASVRDLDAISASHFFACGLANFLTSNDDDINAQQQRFVTPLLSAVAGGHEEVVSMLIGRGADVNVINLDGSTALLIAAERGYTSIVRCLVEHGAKVNFQKGATLHHNESYFYFMPLLNRFKRSDSLITERTPLLAAVAENHVEIVRFLVDRGADVNVKFKDGGTTLHFAAERGNTEIVRILVDSGADVHMPQNDELTPLAVAARKGHLEIVRILMEKGARVENGNIDGEHSALWQAVTEEHASVLKVLLEKFNTINTADCNGKTLLHLASEKGIYEAVRMLIKNGADVNAKVNIPPAVGKADKNVILDLREILFDSDGQLNIRQKPVDGMTPLHLASVNRHSNIINLLLERGGNVNGTDGQGRSPLWYACNVGSADVVRLLIKGGADINAQYDKHLSLLENAIYSGRADVVKELVKGGADVNQQRRADGMTLLAVACQQNDLYVVNSLLENVENVNVTDKLGSTPLAIAASAGLTPVVRLLLEKGADINTPNMKGETPLILAACHGHSETVKLLVERGCNVSEMDKQNKTALQRAANNSHTDVVIFLSDCLTKDPKSSARTPMRGDQQCNTPLHVACDEEKAAFLVEQGGDLFACNIYGCQPLHFAARTSRLKVAAYLIEKGASVNVTNFVGNTPLHEATSLTITKMFVDHHANVDAQNVHGKSPLHIAIENKQCEIATFLVRNGANIELTDHWMNTPFHYLSYDMLKNKAILSIVLDLIKWRHVVLAQSNVFGVTLMMHLRSYVDNALSVYENVLCSRQTAICTDKLGNTELHRIVGVYGANNSFTRSHTESNAHDDRGNPFTRWQIFNPFGPIIFERTESMDTDDAGQSVSQVDINTTNFFGQTPLQAARGIDAIFACIEHGNLQTDDVLKDKQGRNCWHLWTQRDNAENLLEAMISELVKRRDRFEPFLNEVNAGDNLGRTALHYASMSSSSKLIEIVAALTDDVNTQDSDSRTPLHYAAIYGKLEHVHALLKKGGNQNVKDIYGMTVNDYINLQCDHVVKANQCKNSCFCHSRSMLTNVHEVISSLQSSQANRIMDQIRKNKDEVNFVVEIWSNRQCTFHEQPAMWRLNADDKITGLLSSKGLRSVRKGAQDVVYNTLMNITKRISELDKRFTGDIVPVGSIYEETKIDCYDEFDYIIRLRNFSKLCGVRSNPSSPPGYVHIYCAETPVNALFEEFFIGEDKILNTRLIKVTYEILLKRVLNETDFNTSISHLGIVDVVIDNDSQYSFSPDKVASTVKLRYIKPVNGQFVFHDVSVDIVPALYINDWWPDEAERKFSEYIEKYSCFLVFDQPQRKFPWTPWGLPHARVCFSVLESDVIRQSPPVVKAAYMVAKQMSKNFGDFQFFPSYVVKSAVLHCMLKKDLRQYFDVTYDDITKEHSAQKLLSWVRDIMKQVMCFVLQDHVPSVFMFKLMLPVCKFEHYFKFSHIRLDKHKLKYEDLCHGEFFEQEKSSLLSDNQLGNIIKVYISCHLMYWSTLPKDAKLELQFPSIDPVIERNYEFHCQ